MIKIKSIKKLKNEKYIIELYNNGMTLTNILTENVMIKYGLFTKERIDPKDYNKIIKENNYDTLYLKAINYISYQQRTISEVKKHLRKDTKDDTLINNIIQELKEHKYLNDKQYVTDYISEKMEYDLVGPKYIKDKLINKGIHYDLIYDNLYRFTDAMEFDKINQLIKNETKFKIKKPYNKVYVSLKQKLVNKGFNLNIIESALISNKDVIIDAIDEDDLLEREFFKLKPSYNLTNYEDKNKLIKKLIQRGFEYEKIIRIVK